MENENSAQNVNSFEYAGHSKQDGDFEFLKELELPTFIFEKLHGKHEYFFSLFIVGFILTDYGFTKTSLLLANEADLQNILQERRKTGLFVEVREKIKIYNRQIEDNQLHPPILKWIVKPTTSATGQSVSSAMVSYLYKCT